MSASFAIVAFVIALVVSVLIHELGHLLTAKGFGMRADRYFVGFGPTLWSTRRGETEYGLKALPLGGFVSIRGMTPLDERRRPLVDEILDPVALRGDRQRAPEPVGAAGGAAAGPGTTEGTWQRMHAALVERGTPREVADRMLSRSREELASATTLEAAREAVEQILLDEVGPSQRHGDLGHRLLLGDQGRFYRDRPIWQRAIVVFTGPVTHLAIAFLVLLGAYAFLSLPTGEATTEIGAVVPDTPAEEAGLVAGDRLLGVEDLRSEDYFVLRDAIRARAGQPTELLVERDGDRQVIALVPRAEPDPTTGELVGFAGFAPAAATERLSAPAAARRALLGDEVMPFGGVLPLLDGSVRGLATVFSPGGLGDLVAQAVGIEERDTQGAISLVGAASLAGQSAEAGAAGLLNFLFLLASINVFFFIFNLVPLPPFDGGHLAVLAIEKTVNLTRRLKGRAPDFEVDPRAITAVALPVLGILLVVLVATLWLDITDPIRLG